MKGETYYVCKSMKELIAYTKMKRKQRKHNQTEILKEYGNLCNNIEEFIIKQIKVVKHYENY